MGPIFVLLAATGLWFWVLLGIVVSILVIASIERDAPGWATTVMVGTIAFLCLFTDFTHRYDFYVGWRTVVTWIILYAWAGVTWTFVKWYFLLSERKEKWAEAQDEFRESRGLSRGTPVGKDTPGLVEFLSKSNTYSYFVEKNGVWVHGTDRRYYLKVRPRPREHKRQLIAWGVYWPWSFLWSIFDDIVYGFFRWTYRVLSGAYDSMSRWMFPDVD